MRKLQLMLSLVTLSTTASLYCQNQQNTYPQRTRQGPSDTYHYPQSNSLDDNSTLRRTHQGDWGDHENWRYAKEAWYKGETQPQYYLQTHPGFGGGIGYDPDPDYYYFNSNTRSDAYSNPDAHSAELNYYRYRKGQPTNNASFDQRQMSADGRYYNR